MCVVSAIVSWHWKVQASSTNDPNSSPDCSYFTQASVEKINIYCYIQIPCCHLFDQRAERNIHQIGARTSGVLQGLKTNPVTVNDSLKHHKTTSTKGRWLLVLPCVCSALVTYWVNCWLRKKKQKQQKKKVEMEQSSLSRPLSPDIEKFKPHRRTILIPLLTAPTSHKCPSRK